MDFLRENLSTIVVGALVFGILGLVLFTLIRNHRRRGCSCGCSHCNGHPPPKR
ncbi:MAG: FeoB-associated Cys-rich membrane protein [Treponema sp.]|jgi:hypothetical protein|nr:FeoB-associated Cys-rich membrane protein [Treponema sp.]